VQFLDALPGLATDDVVESLPSHTENLPLRVNQLRSDDYDVTWRFRIQSDNTSGELTIRIFDLGPHQPSDVRLPGITFRVEEGPKLEPAPHGPLYPRS
jgi:hypothetical protein